jgi:hypothetical protein
MDNSTSQVRTSSQVFVDADFDVRLNNIKNLKAGTATGHGVEYAQLNLAIKNAVDPILASIHSPSADLAAVKAIAAATRSNAQIMMVEALGLFWYDADNASASNDDTIIRPTDVASDSVTGRWVKHYQTKLYQPNGLNAFVYTDNSGQLHVDGNIIQSGSSYITHAEHVYTTKDLIILRDGAVAGLSNGAYTGIKAKLYDGVNDGQLVFDNAGIARVGDVGAEQAIATRIETPTNGYYAIWDSQNTRINFVAPTASAVGAAANYIFCDDVVFGATSPAWHELEKQSDGGASGSHTATGTSYSELDRYVTPALNTTTVPEGLWSFTFYASMSAHTGKIKAEIYRVNSSGSIVGNVLGTAETAEFGNNTVNAVYASVFIAEQTGWAVTDRIGVVLSGKRYAGTATLTFYHNLATGYVSEMSTPLSLLHNQMAGLNLGDYVHLTAAQAANLKGTKQYQLPITAASTFVPAWTDALNLVGTGGLNALSYSEASFIKMTAANTFALRTLAQTLSDIGAVSGTGTSGQVSFFNGTTTITGDNGLFWDNTNKRLGINTVTPGAPFDVYRLTGNSGYVARFRNEDTTNGYGVAIESEGTATTRYAFTVRNLAGNTTYFHVSTITGTIGYVGLNTVTPSQRLTLNGSGSSQYFLMENGYSGNKFLFGNDSTGGVSFYSQKSDGTVNPYYFFSGSTNILTLASTGAATFNSTVQATQFTSNNSIPAYNYSIAGVGKWVTYNEPTGDIFTIREWGVANWLTITPTTGGVTLSNLAGTGTRMVVADANGVLGTNTALYFIGDNYIKNQNSSAQTANIRISGDIAAGFGRFTSWYNYGSGAGAEIGTSGGYATILGYNRTSSAYIPLYLKGSNFEILSNGATTFNSTLAVGTTMSDWDTTIFMPIQIGYANAFLAGRSDTTSQFQLGTNAYYATTGWKYTRTGYASRYYQADGGHYFDNTVSGTGGAALTFVNALTIANTGAATFASTVSATRFLTPINTDNTTIVAGGIELQSYTVNNSWIGENLYFYGGWRRRNAGYASQIYFETGAIGFYTAPSESAGLFTTWLRPLYLANTGAATFLSTVSATQYTSTIATGTAPLAVSSTTVVANLNASYISGISATQIPYGNNVGATTYIVNDLNAINKSGFYYSNGGGVHLPTGVGTGNLIHISYRGANDYDLQIMSKETGNNLYFRQQTGVNWGSWYELYSTYNLTNPTTGTGTTNYIPKWTGSGTLGNSLFQDDGTTTSLGGSPSSNIMLNIIKASGSGITQQQSAGDHFWSLGFTGHDAYLTHYTSAGLTIGYGETTGGAPIVNTLRLLNNGFVGINTTTPEFLTTLSTTSLDQALLSLKGLQGGTNGAAGSVGILFGYSGVNNYNKAGIFFEGDTSGSAVGTLHFATTGTGGVYTVTKANARMSITGNGNVGIGNTSPSYRLDLSNDANDSTYQHYIRFGTHNQPTAESGGIIWKGNYAGYTKISAKIVAICEGDYFRQGLAFFTENTQDNTTTATEKMRISMAGNVGIGYTDPGTYKLKVNGTGYFNGGVTVAGTDWHRNTASLFGLYNETNANYFYSFVNQGWALASKTDCYPQLIFKSGYEGTVRGYVYSDTTGFGLLNNQGNWMLYSTTNSTNVVFPSYPKLEVGVNFDFDGANRGGIYATKYWLGSGTNYTPAICGEGGLGINFYTNGTTALKMNLSTGGILGISSWYQTANGYGLTAYNAAGTAGRRLISLDSSNYIQIGNDTDIAAISLGTTSEKMAIGSSAITMSVPLTITGNGTYVGNAGYSTLILQDTSGYPGIDFRVGSTNWLQRMDAGTSMSWYYSTNASAQASGSYTQLMTLGVSGILSLLGTVASTSTTTGTLVVGGGVGVSGKYYGTTMALTHGSSVGLTLNGSSNHLLFHDTGGGSDYYIYMNSGDSKLRWWSVDADKMTLTTAGNLYTAGTGTFNGGGFNSLRSRKNLNPDWRGSALDVIKDFKVRDFYYKNEPEINRTLGFILDEVPESIQQYVWMGEKKDAINLYSLHALSFKGIQEVKSEVDILKDEVRQLKQKLERYELG